jgi:proliferating cell nuclear antigen PCNA
MSTSARDFHCKTSEGHIIKGLAELLQNNIKAGAIEITPHGLNSKVTDTNKKILIDLHLNSEAFSIFKMRDPNESITIGLNNSHFYRMLKSSKKKDSISLFIENDRQAELGIEVIPKEKTRVTVSYIKIQRIQALDIELPESYDRPVIINSGEFQKMIKDMSNIGNAIEIYTKCRQISFRTVADSVFSRSVTFGEEDTDDQSEEVSQIFDLDIFSRISKIASLSTQLKIYQHRDLPLLIRSPVGTLGEISIYIKSKSQIESENIEV